MNEMTNTSSMPKIIFSLAIIIYLIVFGALFVFVSHVFGLGAAILLSLMPLFPLIIAIRMGKKWLTLKGREFVYLGILLIITFCAVPGLIWSWYDSGLDYMYAAHLERMKFVDLLHKDPAFRNLQLVEKRGCWLEGTVPTEADLVRLKSILDQNHKIGDSIDCQFVTSSEQITNQIKETKVEKK
jgi:hypothetical protein